MSKVFNMVGGGGSAASIFVTGLSETYTVTATNGSKTLTGKWMQKPNPESISLPSGYTQLEYIESTGTQYIDTGLSLPSGFRFVGDIQVTDSSGPGNIIGAEKIINGVGYRNNFTYYNSGWGIGAGGWGTKDMTVSHDNSRIEFSNIVGDDLYLKINGESVAVTFSSGYPKTDNRTDESLFVFALRNNLDGTNKVTQYAKFKNYGMSVYSSADDSSLVGNFIPCKRNSDGVVGLYDLVSNTFFENAGTGEFDAGPEVPQTFDGFLIKPIRDLGTWTVTATNGTDTVTQNVLVDVITNYEIEMAFFALVIRQIYQGPGVATISEQYEGIKIYAASNSNSDYSFANIILADGDGNPVIPKVGDKITVTYSLSFDSNGLNGGYIAKVPLAGGTNVVISSQQSITDYSYVITDADKENFETFVIGVQARANGSSTLILTKFEINGVQIPFVQA